MNKNRKKNNKSNNNLTIIFLIIIVIILIIFGIYLSNNGNELNKTMKHEGFTTKNEDDAFYNKIVTNNTLDDYYNDMKNQKNSEYEQYYFTKESYDFIEVKLSYNNQVSTSLNITSDLKTLYTNYNYELSYKDVHLIIEGNSAEEYACRKIIQENIEKDQIDLYCDKVHSEIQTFLKRREELLQNENIKELLQ